MESGDDDPKNIERLITKKEKALHTVSGLVNIACILLVLSFIPIERFASKAYLEVIFHGESIDLSRRFDEYENQKFVQVMRFFFSFTIWTATSSSAWLLATRKSQNTHIQNLYQEIDSLKQKRNTLEIKERRSLKLQKYYNYLADNTITQLYSPNTTYLYYVKCYIKTRVQVDLKYYLAEPNPLTFEAEEIKILKAGFIEFTKSKLTELFKNNSTSI